MIVSLAKGGTGLLHFLDVCDIHCQTYMTAFFLGDKSIGRDLTAMNPNVNWEDV